MPDLVDGRHRPLGNRLGDPGLLLGQSEVLRVGGGQVRSIAGLRAEPLEEPAQRIERGEHRAPAEPFTRARADVFGQPVLEPDRLLNVKPFEVAIFGVVFELGERGCGAIDGMLAKAPRLLEVDEVGAFDSLIFRVVHPAPAPSHSLRRDRAPSTMRCCACGNVIVRFPVAAASRGNETLRKMRPRQSGQHARRLPEVGVIGDVFGDGRHRVFWGPAPDAIDLAGPAWRPIPAAPCVQIRLELGAPNENRATPINRLETIPEPISNRVFVASQHSRGLLHGVTPVDLDAARIEPLHPPSPHGLLST